ncbi:MAG: thiamine-phosphate pyrophosphorylase [Candidatus Omnitrophota bacterium]|jgi:thiamine-phosphate pyrophosphorylase
MDLKSQNKILRVIDANFNRTKEGLRVCEDICRFMMNDATATRRFKDIRHGVTEAIGSLKLKQLIEARSIERDVGRDTTDSELSRGQVKDILYANMQRVKESMRVLEEFMKIKNPKIAVNIKQLRYKVYALEQRIITKS